MDYKDENTWLMLGDCVKRMKNMSSESVDCVITDAPYGIDFSEWDVLHNNNNSALLGKSPANEGSSVFKSRGKPLNGWSEEDKYKSKQIQQWVEKWMVELFRITKPCSPVLIFTGRQYLHRFAIAAEDTGFVLKDTISWDKKTAVFRAQRVSCVLERRGVHIGDGDWRLGNLSPQVEPILYLFNPYPTGTTITDQFLSSGLGCINTANQKSNLISISSRVVDKKHETQKPVELMELLVELVSKEGHTVLDPFMGSGTTGVACKNLGRKFIGVERDPEYFNIAKERIIGEENPSCVNTCLGDSSDKQDCCGEHTTHCS